MLKRRKQPSRRLPPNCLHQKSAPPLRPTWSLRDANSPQRMPLQQAPPPPRTAE
jgi:hypothetical protein